MNNCIDLNRPAPGPADGAALPASAPDGKSGRARNGKIARLPHALRETLNERLRDGAPFEALLSWLNSLPEAREALQKHFDGAPIVEQNLSRWRCGGYLAWFEEQQAKEAIAIMSAAGRNIDPADREGLTSQLALAVSARMVFELRRFDEMPEGPAKTAAWKDLVWGLTLLRRGEFYAGKLRLEQEKLAPRKEEAEAPPQCEQERRELGRRIMGLGGPHWNNVTKQYEGEGAEEMTERDEVERLIVEELRRRKEAKTKEEGRIKKEETTQKPDP